MGDYDSDGRPDFTLTDSLSNGGSYSVVAEASDIKGLGITAYQSNGFAIVSQGEFLGAVRRVKAEIVHDSFLKFARFVSVNDLSYACAAVLTGEVYTGGDLDIPCGCASGQQAQFLESAYAVGDIPNAGCGLFYRGYVTDAEEIDLENSFDWTDTEDKAQGRAAENDCENMGDAGIYIKIGTSDPLGTGNTIINLSLFDFYDLTTVPGDTVIAYNGNPIPHPQHFPDPMRHSEFNGMVVVVGDAYVSGTMDGKSAHPMTIFAKDDLIVTGNIVTGHRGWDEVTGLPTGSGDPVNLGLVAEDYVEMGVGTPRVLRVDGALFSRTNTWRGAGGTSSADHPKLGNGAYDFDLDGITGESPINHDPVPGDGWDEVIDTAGEQTDTWVLNINGPIITKFGGSAYPWNDATVLANADGPTRRYNYDLDMTAYPPPCYPVPLNLWKDVSWTEIFDVRTDLASHPSELMEKSAMNPPALPPPSPRAGFNLVEMMVTLVIIGIVVAAAVPNFTSRNERYRVEGAAQELGTRIQLARQRAVAERVPYRATIDPGDRVYFFERQEDDSTWVRSPDQVYEIEGVTDIELTIGGREAETIVRLETRGTLQLEDAPVEMKFMSATEDTATLSVVRTGRAIVTMSN